MNEPLTNSRLGRAAGLYLVRRKQATASSGKYASVTSRSPQLQNGTAKLPGPPARPSCRAKPGWRPRSGAAIVRRPSANQALVDPAILHDDEEVLGRVRDQFDVLEGVAIDQQQIGQCAFFHDTQLAGIGVALPRHGQELGIGPGR